MGTITLTKQQEPQSFPIRDFPSTLRSRPSSSRDGTGSPTSDTAAIVAKKRVAISPTPSTESSAKPAEELDAKTLQRANSDLETVFPGHTTPWSKKLILTLDGGGVLAYSSLIVLEVLMDRIRKIEQRRESPAVSSADSPLFDSKSVPKHVPDNIFIPCHYFDYIAGTSIGGSIAIMLGRYRMSVDDCIKRFNAHAIGFDQEPPIDIIHFSLRHLSSSTPSWSSSESEKLYQPSSGVEVEPTITDTKRREFNMDPLQCKTLAICEQIHKDRDMVEPYMFRSYDSPNEPITVFDVARAITTRPRFKPYKNQYYDGSPRAYNPSHEVYKEVSALQDEGKNAIELLLSLGTSATGTDTLRKLGMRSFYRFITSKEESLISKESRRQKVDSKLRKEGINYSRLQVPHVLPRRGKHVLPQIEKATRRYVEQPLVNAQLDHYAKILVRKRRARAETRSWETFALGIRYRCYFEDCLTHGKDFSDREEFLDHLMQAGHVKKQPVSSREEVQAALDKGRIY